MLFSTALASWYGMLIESKKRRKQKGRPVNDYPLTAKEQHKRKEKLAKMRQSVMLILMLIAGLYYLMVERSQMTNTVVVTSVKEASSTVEEGNSIAAGETTKYTIEGFAEPESIEQPVNDTSPIAQAVSDTAAPPIQAVPVAEITAIQIEDKRVNLNTATLEELDELPGVGPSTAKNIIAYREAHGGFAAPEEIMNVKRIGEKTYMKLKELIKV